MSTSDRWDYEVEARTTDTFGRVLCSARTHHFIVDGPPTAGRPGEEVTPPEIFLAGVASCGAELLQVIAREEDVPLERVRLSIRGRIDRDRPVREDVTLFNRVHLRFEITGPSEAEGHRLVKAFKGR